MKNIHRIVIGFHLLAAVNCAIRLRTAIKSITEEMKNELICRVGVKGAMGGNITLTSMKLLGSGAHGFVYPGETDDGIPVAIKFVKDSTVSYKRELRCYEKLDATTNKECTKYGIPFIYHTGTLLDYKTMAMTKLDTDLSSLHNKIGPFSKETILIIFGDTIRTLKYMHGKGITHGDIKPENILVKGANVFVSDLNQCHEKGLRNRPNHGAPKYTSIAVQIGASQAEYDDMQSLFYSMIEMADVKLPWDGILSKQEILEHKQRATAESLCSQLKIPELVEPFTRFSAEVNSSAQEKRLPKYDFLYKIFDDALYSGRNRSERIVFEWLTAQ